jgi:hypothetical protein
MIPMVSPATGIGSSTRYHDLQTLFISVGGTVKLSIRDKTHIKII